MVSITDGSMPELQTNWQKSDQFTKIGNLLVKFQLLQGEGNTVNAVLVCLATTLSLLVNT